MAWHTHREPPEECVCVYTLSSKVDWELVGMDSPWAGWDLAWKKHA